MRFGGFSLAVGLCGLGELVNLVIGSIGIVMEEAEFLYSCGMGNINRAENGAVPQPFLCRNSSGVYWAS